MLLSNENLANQNMLVDILVNISYVSGKLESMQSCNLSSQCHNFKKKKQAAQSRHPEIQEIHA
jgi:hypothetical protein